jgi:8-oxo-dGTP diphosphatase
MLEVALAMVEQDGKWLLQLRDDLDWIVAPGCWGLFGGHLEPGETPEQALRRELMEEIRWQAKEMRYWFAHRNTKRIAHFFLSNLPEPLDTLQLLEGQDVLLADLDELKSGRVWSPAAQAFRPLAPSLQVAVEALGRGSHFSMGI